MAKQVLSDLDFNNTGRITNLADAVNPQDAATKAQLDRAVEGLAWKDSCRVATQSNINLSSPSATIDGITMTVNDRVLVMSQSTPAQNGIYIFNGASTAMTRALDASTSAELEQAVLTVEEGTSAGATYRQTSINFTLDTDDVVWAAFGTAVAQATETVSGKVEIATQTETDTGTDDQRVITPLKLATWSGRPLKHNATIGDGSNTSYTVTHNLGTRNVQVTVSRVASPYDVVITDVELTSINSVTIKFASAPSSNQFNVAILG